jgi:hypothetical protein
MHFVRSSKRRIQINVRQQWTSVPHLKELAPLVAPGNSPYSIDALEAILRVCIPTLGRYNAVDTAWVANYFTNTFVGSGLVKFTPSTTCPWKSLIPSRYQEVGMTRVRPVWGE